MLCYYIKIDERIKKDKKKSFCVCNMYVHCPLRLSSRLRMKWHSQTDVLESWLPACLNLWLTSSNGDILVHAKHLQCRFYTLHSRTSLCVTFHSACPLTLPLTHRYYIWLMLGLNLNLAPSHMTHNKILRKVILSQSRNNL